MRTKQILLQAVASVAADRMSKRAIHPGHILAPIPNIPPLPAIPGGRTLEDPNDRSRFLSLDGQAQAAFAGECSSPQLLA